MKAEAFYFQPGIKKCLAKRQVMISRNFLIAILNKVGVEKVRVIEHGLKYPYFSDLFGKIDIVLSSDNRFDFGTELKT